MRFESDAIQSLHESHLAFAERLVAVLQLDFAGGVRLAVHVNFNWKCFLGRHIDWRHDVLDPNVAVRSCRKRIGVNVHTFLLQSGKHFGDMAGILISITYKNETLQMMWSEAAQRTV